VEAEFAYRGVLLHRADLQRVLASAVPDEWVHLGRGAVGLSQTSEGVDIQLSDGTVERADIVVGADGLRSVVRDFLFPVPLRYSGQSCLWGVANLTLDSTLQRHALELWGGDQRFGFAPLKSTSGEGSDRVYWFAPFRSREGLPRPDNARQFLRSHWRAFPEPVGSIIDATPEELILHTDLYDIRPLPKWWKGRTLLLGDAAHATTPNLGQGGAQAIEDAAVLSRLLRALRGDPSDIEACFRKFQAIRHPKTTHITKQAWSLGKMAHWSQPLLCGVRNIAVTSMPAALMRRQMKVLFSHERGEATANSGTP
jgi:2-polyprenyl-6-methoxyphenol hydroxylase-like FAD-dependent oxidoreductase